VEALALPAPALDLQLQREGGCAALANGQIDCWSRLPHSVDDAPAIGALTRALWAVPLLAGARSFLAVPPMTDLACADLGGTAACVQGLSQPEAVVAVPVPEALAGASRLVAVRSDGSAFCAALADASLRCQGTGTPGALVNPGQLRVEVSAPGAAGSSGAPERRRESGMVPYDGGLCLGAAGGGWRCAGEPSALTASLPSRIALLALGRDHACALAEGQTSCWGQAARGQLGTGTRYLHSEALPVPGIDDAIFLDASSLQACAVRRGGAVVCWGALITASGARELAFAPRALDTPQPAEEVRAAHLGPPATSREHQLQPTCVRSATGWWCQDGPRFVRERSGEVSPLDRWTRKLASYSPDRACGVTSEAGLVCAGAPSSASSERSVRSQLVRASAPERLVQASSLFSVGGREHVCGRSAGGKLFCFAVAAAPDAAPVAAPGLAALSDIVDVQAGRAGTDGLACALGRSGTVWCWGGTRVQQVSASAQRTPWDPVVVPQLPPVVQLAVGGAFACARAQAGEVYCWGDDRTGTAPNGELGVRSEARPVSLFEAAPSSASR
jgi:hypothetical protein